MSRSSTASATASTASRCTARSTRSRPTPRSACSSSAPSNRWIDGAHNRSTIKAFYGAGQEDSTRTHAFTIDAGEPAILLGSDTGPNPAEALLHALAACLTTSLVYVAAARKVRLTAVESTLEGDMDVRGALGLSDEVRNGFSNIRVSFKVPATRRRRSCASSSSARRRAPSSSTWSPTVSRSRWGSSRTELGSGGRGYGPRPPSATTSRHARADRQHRRRRPPGAPRRVARPGAGAARPRARPRRRRSRTRAIDALKAAGYFTAPIPAELGGLGVTSVHDVVVASSRLARGDASVAIGVNMHFAVAAEHGPALAGRGRGRRRAAGARLRLLDGGDRARRRDHGHRDQRAGPGPDAALDDGDAHGVGLADRRAQDLLHDVAGRDRAPDRGHLRRRRRRRALRLRGDRSRAPTACGSTTTGTRSACAPRAATP